MRDRLETVAVIFLGCFFAGNLLVYLVQGL